MICIKCNKEIPAESVFCMFCGKKQSEERKKPVKHRGNGQGTVYKKGDKYVAVVTIGYENGKRKTKSKTFEKKKDAVSYLPSMKRFTGKIDENITFAEAFNRAVDMRAQNISEKTVKGYRSAFRHFALIEKMPLNTVKTDHLQMCVDRCGKGRRTKQLMQVCASLAFNYGRQNDIVDRSYSEFMALGKDDSKEREPFTKEEIEKIYKASATVPYADYILCMIFTGFRPSEFYDLKKENVKDGYIIGGGKTEAGKNRIIPIASVIQPIIEKQLQTAGEYLFPTAEGKQLSQKNFSKRHYYPALEQIGVRKLSPYSCRHTFATMLKDIEAPATDKQRLMGHASFSMTAHYTHTDIDSLKRITDLLKP